MGNNVLVPCLCCHFVDLPRFTLHRRPCCTQPDSFICLFCSTVEGACHVCVREWWGKGRKRGGGDRPIAAVSPVGLPSWGLWSGQHVVLPFWGWVCRFSGMGQSVWNGGRMGEWEKEELNKKQHTCAAFDKQFFWLCLCEPCISCKAFLHIMLEIQKGWNWVIASGKPTFYFIMLYHAFSCFWCFLKEKK